MISFSLVQELNSTFGSSCEQSVTPQTDRSILLKVEFLKEFLTSLGFGP